MSLIGAGAILLAGATAALAQAASGNVPPDGAKAAHSVARSENALTRTERQAEQQRLQGEQRFKRRDESMRKSMKSICSGC